MGISKFFKLKEGEEVKEGEEFFLFDLFRPLVLL